MEASGRTPTAHGRALGARAAASREGGLGARKRSRSCGPGDKGHSLTAAALGQPQGCCLGAL
eukprot:5369248-Pyramimonas_sp.AAC.1